MSIRLDKILCATDFSQFSTVALHCGVNLAHQFNSHLLVSHTVCFPRNQIYGTAASARGGEQEDKENYAFKKINQFMRNQSLSWEPLVTQGEPVDETTRLTNEQDVDLVVAASHGLSGLKRILLGTVVERMARGLSKPLLVTRVAKKASPKDNILQTPLKIKRILMACDFSHDSQVVLGYALSFARKFNARLYLMHAVETPINEDIVDPTDAPYGEVQKILEDKLLQKITKIVPEDDIKGCNLKPALFHGLPGEGLCSYATENKIDLIVVGVRHRGAFEKMLIGSTTEAVLRCAPCSVLTVPPAVLNGRMEDKKIKSKTKLKTGIVRDERYLNHLTGEGHPENHKRLEAIYTMLDEPDMDGYFASIDPRPAEREELLLLHSPEYIDKIAATAGKDGFSLTPDTHTSPGSYEAALLAAGGLFEAISRVVSGELANAFALVRPPGHHAERSRAMGYCLFSNVALGAIFARESLGLKRILIVDFDVHHGNGTQHFFEQDPWVLFFSTHQYPHFPGTGSFTETGLGRGEGYTVNIPLGKGYGDSEFIAIFEKLLRPIAQEFEPDLIIVSAGFDIHKSDPMSKMKITTKGFAGLTRSIMETADICCGGKLVFSLEGGYNIKTIGKCVKVVLNELAGHTTCSIPKLTARASRKKFDHAFKRCSHVHKQFWKNL
ncbi:MAG: universal stress protein [Thermodesulfobacteriota bacterium]|nr:universal stress protein [Thermodesulfobacteriota bacterium]